MGMISPPSVTHPVYRIFSMQRKSELFMLRRRFHLYMCNRSYILSLFFDFLCYFLHNGVDFLA